MTLPELGFLYDRRSLIPRSLTYIFSMKVVYALKIPHIVELPEYFPIAMLVREGSTFHVQGDDVVASASNQALEWPKVSGASGSTDLVLSGASSEGFRGNVFFQVEGARRIAADHIGRLKVNGGTRRLNQLRRAGSNSTQTVTGTVRAAFRFNVDNARFRWLELNQLVGVGNFSATRMDAEKIRSTDKDALTLVADFDIYGGF